MAGPGRNTGMNIAAPLIGIYLAIFLVGMVSLGAQPTDFMPPSGTEFVGGDEVLWQWNAAPGWTVTILYRTDQMSDWDTIATDLTTAALQWGVPFWKQVDSVFVRFVATALQPPVLLFELPNAHAAEIRTVRFSPSGRYVLSVGKDARAKIWDVKTRQVVATIPADLQQLWQSTEPTAFQGEFWHSPDTVLLTVGRQLVRWLPFEGKWEFVPMIGVALPEDDFIRTVAVWKNQLVFGTDDGVLVWLRLVNGMMVQAKVMQQFTPPRIYDVAWTPDGNSIFAVGSDGKLHQYFLPGLDPQVYAGEHGRDGGSKVIWSCDVSPDYQWVLTGGVDRRCQRWSVVQRQVVEVLPPAQSHVRVVRWAPHRREFFAAGLDGKLRQWWLVDDTSQPVPWQPIDHQAPIITAEYAPSGDTLATAGRQDFTIRFWRNGTVAQWDTVLRYSYRLPLCVSLPVLYTVPERNERIPVVLHCPPVEYREGDSVRVQLMMPSALLYPYSSTFNAEIRYGYPQDTVLFTFDPSQLLATDTIGWLRVRVLHGPPREDSLIVRSVQARDYRDRSKNGFVVLQDTCRLLDSVAFVPGTVRLHITPVDEGIQYRFVIPYDTPYQLLLFDSRGSLVQLVAMGNAATVDEKTVSFRHIPPGWYWIVLRTPYQTIVRPVQWMP